MCDSLSAGHEKREQVRNGEKRCVEFFVVRHAAGMCGKNCFCLVLLFHMCVVRC